MMDELGTSFLPCDLALLACSGGCGCGELCVCAVVVADAGKG